MQGIPNTKHEQRIIGQFSKRRGFAMTRLLFLLLVVLLPISSVAQPTKQFEFVDGMEWAFSVATNGTVWIERNDEYVGDVVIPRTLDGRPVYGIGNTAFSDCSDLTSISIPEGVTVVGWGAFQNCIKLDSIRIPHGTTFVGGAAFRNCSRLESITIPLSVNDLFGTTFDGCSSLKQVAITVNSNNNPSTEQIDKAIRKVKIALKSSFAEDADRVSVVVEKGEDVNARSFSEQLESRIKEMGRRYTKTDDGSFQFETVYDTNEGKRKQETFVDGDVVVSDGIPFAVIRSVAIRSKMRPVDGNQMKSLLDVRKTSIGHWCLRKPSDNDGVWCLYHSIAIPLSSTANELRQAIAFCSYVADKKERELAETDEN